MNGNSLKSCPTSNIFIGKVSGDSIFYASALHLLPSKNRHQDPSNSSKQQGFTSFTTYRRNSTQLPTLVSSSTTKIKMAGSNIIYMIIWFLLLLFIAWPISWFCAWWWCVLIAFESLFPFIKDCADFLEKIISWPRVVGRACLTGDKQFPSPW
jgi:hypothetical protein